MPIAKHEHIYAAGKRYYPCLNGLRAIAALLVLFTHIERIRQPLGMPGLIDFKFNEFLGGLAVTFFFTLSGFLITSLLLAEKTTQGTIRLRRFFINRALRIWPLYLVVLIAGYLVSVFLMRDTPRNPMGNGFLLNLLFLPNLAFALGILPEILIHLWSVGTEEQFYLVWPFLLKRLPPKILPRLFLGIIVFWGVARGIIRLTGPDWLNILLFRTRIDCMAIGGFAALFPFDKERWKPLNDLVLRRATGPLAAIAFALLLIVSHRYHESLYQLYALLSALLILRVIDRPVKLLESPVPRFLGKISYGIYLLQLFVIFFLFRILTGLTPTVQGQAPAQTAVSSRPAGIAIYLLAVLLTTGLAYLSYTFYESWFLKRKISL